MEHPVLFEVSRQLRRRLPWTSLGEFPTPVKKLERLGREAGLGNLYVKRDDLSSPYYGGNKVRKLEFLLADAHRRHAPRVITVGGIGSNHALATTIHGRRVGLPATLLLVDQPPSSAARRNVLLDRLHGARLVKSSSAGLPLAALRARLVGLRVRPPALPYWIPLGGSSPLGTVGFVNGAFELKRQVEEGLLPEPDVIYVASGSMGTAAGLHLGCRLAGLKTRVIGVRVTPTWLCTARKTAALVNRTSAFLCRCDPALPRVTARAEAVTVLDDYFGREYGLFTEEGMRAVRMMRGLEGIQLEGTYTGKALAGALDQSRREVREDSTILFWNTYNSVDLSAEAAALDYHDLPTGFHAIFEQPLQELDAAGHA